MNTSFDLLFEIAWRFASLSLLAIGGINALLPEIHRVVVEVEGWMTSAEFADLFALAQLAPGPNAMVVSLLGWKVAGIAGAFVATIASCGPSSVVCYFAIRGLERLRNGAGCDRAHFGERLYARASGRPDRGGGVADDLRRHRGCSDARQSDLDSGRRRTGRRGRRRVTGGLNAVSFFPASFRGNAKRRSGTRSLPSSLP